jgi:1-acyl-sn-glycerol-3-phosphate acyltransferase
MDAGGASRATGWRGAAVGGADRLPAPLVPRRRFHRACRTLLRPVFRAAFGMQASGLEHLPAHGPYILAANHVSMLDWAFLSYYLPDLVRFVVHREYWDHPLLGIGLRFNGAVPLRTGAPDGAAFRLALAVLADGEPLIMFPEGAISRSGRPQRGQPGIIALAAAARVPIVPAALRGAFEAFPRHRRLPRPRPVRLAVGAPLPPPAPPDRAAQRALAGGLMRHIGALLDGVAAPPPPW